MSLAWSSRNEIQLLSSSAAFAMSLGAKELFHTNFLAFMLESDDPALVSVQLAIRRALGFSPAQGAAPKCAVWREKNNLDLVIVELQPLSLAPTTQRATATDEEDADDQPGGESGGWDWSPTGGWTQSTSNSNSGVNSTAASFPRSVPTGRVLIVEAKLKSIPRLDRLTKYDNQLSTRGDSLDVPEDGAVSGRYLLVKDGAVSIERRLLSVAGISMTTPGTITRADGQWVGVTWKSIHGAMNGAVHGPSSSSISQTLTDYTQALGALVALFDRVHQMCNDAHLASGPTPTYGALRLQPLDSQFRSLRINDLLGKTLFDYWLHTFVLKGVTVNIPAGWALKGYVHYSRGTPGLGLELVNDSFQNPNGGPNIGLRIGIQVQNCELRLYVDVHAGWSGLEKWVAGHTVLPGRWFNTPVFSCAPVGYRGLPPMPATRTGRATNLKMFGVDRFLYSKLDIDNRPLVNVETELGRLIAHAAELAPLL